MFVWSYDEGDNRKSTAMQRGNKRNNVSRIRRVLGLRQLDLARRLDIYQSEVSAIERGEREPGVHLAQRIARALGRSVEDVF